MSLTSSGECGISPFLLQAISSLTPPESQMRDKPVAHLVMESSQQQQQQQQQQHGSNNSKSVTHLLQGMNEPLTSLLPAYSSSSSPNNCNGDTVVQNVKPEEVTLNADIQERLAAQLALKQGRQVTVPASLGSSTSSSTLTMPAVSDMSMVNVLTALASQHVKASVKQEETESYSGYVSSASPSFVTTTAAPTTADVMIQPGLDGSQRDRPQPQIIIYYNNAAGSASSPNVQAVGAVEGSNKGQQSMQNYRLILQPGSVSSATTMTSLSELAVQSVISESAAAAAAPAFSEGVGTYCEAADAMSMNGRQSSESEALRESPNAVCPVCGDKISGYHYGVYTCESCKGFFKRTVQNKKSFMCHKQGDCEVMIQNRKKCPACRFAKCIAVGMKLEAIRQDRMRGGRSSYNGSLPLVKPKPVQTQRKIKRVSTDSVDVKVGVVPASDVPDQAMTAAEDDGKSHGQLAALLNHSSAHGQQAPQSQGPPVPELLMDIMNLEALLVDEDIPTEGAEDGRMDEQAFYQYLMQLTELRLYKLVRWARNLPQFGAISTDDQILLLQNCWSDLLALGVCWRSLASSGGGVLSLSATHSVSLEQAEALGFGDVVARLLSIAEALQSVSVDQLEYVALKVLLLITPDVKGLREPAKVHDYQEKLSEALATYTMSHYPQLPGKFGEMLLRLPELARISFLARQILLAALPPALASCGLLVELLKGENAAKD